MGRRSTKELLPAAIQKEVDKKFAEGWTIQQVVDLLAEAGHPTPYSTVGHWAKNAGETAKQLRQGRDVIEALGKELGEDATSGKHGRLLVEISRNLVHNMLSQQLDNGEGFDPKEFAYIGKALKDFAQASRLDQDFEMKIRAQVEEETRKKIAVDVEVVGKKAGWSAAHVAETKRAILYGEG